MRPLLSFNDVAALCRVSTRTVRRFVARGLLKPIHITSKTVRFSEADVLRLIEDSGITSDQDSASSFTEITQSSHGPRKCGENRRHDSPSTAGSDTSSRVDSTCDSMGVKKEELA
ncbi:helix-turn-helix domain-containing protein [Roseimicrobium gellanilyticum]|uniref:helix-turn-helix transcriptional regulator n=1 Tax=Roseimicrobium gellanilyticum TaxID=748857 RepID=UPI000DE9E848